MSFLFWFVAVGALALAWLIYLPVGPNPVTQGLWVLTVVAMLLAHLAERLERS
jgi:hypothetical protein